MMDQNGIRTWDTWSWISVKYSNNSVDKGPCRYLNQSVHYNLNDTWINEIVFFINSHSPLPWSICHEFPNTVSLSCEHVVQSTIAIPNNHPETTIKSDMLQLAHPSHQLTSLYCVHIIMIGRIPANDYERSYDIFQQNLFV